MTLREEIQAELVIYKAKVAELEAHLATGGTWLEMESEKVKEELVKLWAYLHRSQPATPEIPQNPTQTNP